MYYEEYCSVDSLNEINLCILKLIILLLLKKIELYIGDKGTIA